MRSARPLRCLGWILAVMLAGGCAVTRPVPVTLDQPGVSAFLAEHPQSNLRVTEESGRRYWIHAPEIRGDSLVGRRGYDRPVQALSVPLNRITELGTTHFSWGRTGALVGGAAVGIFGALAILLSDAGIEPTE